MAIHTWAAAQDASTDAAWRTWGQAIHNALVALGTLVQTSDTGQANWTTATRPGNTSATVYEVWAFADTLQSTAPTYVRIAFGNLSSQPVIYLRVGTGTNGAGTLTGNVSTEMGWLFTQTTTAQNHYLSGTTSRLTGWLEADSNNGAGSNGAIFTIERALSNTGSELATGVQFLGQGNAAVAADWITAGSVNLPATVRMNDSPWAHNCIFASGQTLIATQMTAFTVNILGINYQVQNPPIGILLYRSDDLAVGPPGTLPQITLYGVARTYINTGSKPSTFNVNSAARAMMLYE